MNISMTVGDMVVNLALAVLAIALWAWLPRLKTSGQLWWAERSQKSRHKRLGKLEAELRDYRELLTDPLRFHARALDRMLMCVLWAVMLPLVTSIFALLYAHDAYSTLQPREPSLTVPVTPEVSFFVKEVLPVLFFFYPLARLRFALTSFGNIVRPKQNIERLETAIARLRQ